MTQVTSQIITIYTYYLLSIVQCINCIRLSTFTIINKEVLKVGSQIFQVNHIVGPVTFAGKSQHNLVSFTSWLVLVKQTIS